MTPMITFLLSLLCIVVVSWFFFAIDRRLRSIVAFMYLLVFCVWVGSMISYPGDHDWFSYVIVFSITCAFSSLAGITYRYEASAGERAFLRFFAPAVIVLLLIQLAREVL